MDTRAILKDGLMLSGRRFWATGFGMAFTYMSASLLGPQGFGLLAILRLIPSLAVIVSLGWVDASRREILHLQGSGNSMAGLHLRAVAYTAETAITLVWLPAILGYSLVASDWTTRPGCGLPGSP